MLSEYKDDISLHPGEVKEKTENLLWYVFCPECGKQINKSGQGTVVMQTCPKCGIQLSIEVAEDQLIVGVKRSISKEVAQRVYRGEVYFASFSHTTGAEILGAHPIVIVQNNIGNYYSSTVIGVVLTSSNKKETMPTHVILQEPGSPCNGSMAMAEQIFTIDKQRLRGYVGRLSEYSMRRIDEAMRQSLSISRKEPTMMCLCPRCVRAFEELPHHSVRRVDWKQQTKDTCTYCGMGMGYDYWIHDWSSLVKQNREPVSTIVQ